MRVSFLMAAREELEAATEYYEASSAGLGQRFVQAVRAATDVIRQHPDIGSERTASTRALAVRGFPFTVVYRIRSQSVTIVAVAHQRRRPGYWRGRV